MPLLILAALLAEPMPAAARDHLLDEVPAVVAVKNRLRRLCAAQGRVAHFSGDFYDSVDATGSGAARDIYLRSEYGCYPRDPRSRAEPTIPTPGRIWLIVQQPRGGYRLVWSGTTPALGALGTRGLLEVDAECRDQNRCWHYVWNGRALVRQQRRVTRVDIVE